MFDNIVVFSNGKFWIWINITTDSWNANKQYKKLPTQNAKQSFPFLSNLLTWTESSIISLFRHIFGWQFNTNIFFNEDVYEVSRIFAKKDRGKARKWSCCTNIVFACLLARQAAGLLPPVLVVRRRAKRANCEFGPSGCTVLHAIQPTRSLVWIYSCWRPVLKFDWKVLFTSNKNTLLISLDISHRKLTENFLWI